MDDLIDAAVETADAILTTYRDQFGASAFPTIKDRLFRLIEARATSKGIDNLYVKRFKEKMHPIVGQMRRIRESNGAYMPVEEHGVIYLCPSLDLDWQRFILVKEASHLLLDSPDEYVHDETEMDRLMVCLAQFGEKGVTKQYHSELRAQVCAIELLFPKPSRDKLRPRFLTGEVSASEIATKARIPTHFVRAAMEEWYHDAAAASYERLAQKAASPKLNLSENDNESAAAE